MKKGLLKKVLSIGMIGVVSFGLMACGAKAEGSSADAKPKSKLEEIKEKKKLVVGLSADYAPYEFHAMIEGKDTIVGFDVDFAKEVAKDLGVELEIKEMNFNSLITGIDANQIDMIISGMNPDEERKKSVLFSDIYYEAQHGVLVNAKDKDKYKDEESLKSKGLKIGAQMGSIQEKYTKEVLKAEKPTLMANVNNLILELKTGKIDALVTEEPVAKMAMKQNKEMALLDFKIKPGNGKSVGNAVAVKKGEETLIAEVNKTIKRLVASGDMDKFIVEANELASKNIEKK